MALISHPSALIGDSSLEGWKVIGSGGFGQIYKARHRQWGCDVAIKVLHFDDGNSASLLREIDMMRQGCSPYVIQVRGVFRGQTPSSGPSTQLGLVMEVMERGSLLSLQGSVPSWPLVFRLAHQVALGINFLHTLTPPLLHLDLKPSNVLLDSSLNAKLTDFGLARLYHSITRTSRKDSEEEGGTISYMPPEAFHLSYSPTRASDIYRSKKSLLFVSCMAVSQITFGIVLEYAVNAITLMDGTSSYGILLWSIVTGKQPYPFAESSLVRLRIPEGDRPSMDEIRRHAAGIAGLTRMMVLMERCWDTRPQQRPSALACTMETEELYKMHKHAINDAVHEVVKRLDQIEEERMLERVERVHISQPSETFAQVCDNVPTGRPPIQEMAGGWTANERVTDPPSSFSGPAVGDKVKRSSVCPIRSTPPSPSTAKSAQGRTTNPSQQAFRENLSPQYQRQFSSPDSFPCHPAPSGGIQIHLSNVTGFQHGNNNTMHIQVLERLDRKRHPTAPPRVDLPQPAHPASWKEKTGGLR